MVQVASSINLHVCVDYMMSWSETWHSNEHGHPSLSFLSVSFKGCSGHLTATLKQEM